MATEQQEIVAKNTYDESPYESYPFAQTSIANLSTIAHLFGLKTPNIETARILELGCASGGNIIPQAALYPKAKFVGVDLSAEQVKVGEELIKKAGLKNIEIKAASITDIDKSYGEFDYIICHGVLSWVPDFVREAIFKVCAERLSPTGVSYISYNTLPGWNMVRSIRDMMLYHSRGFANVEDKITQSALLLEFIKDSLDGSDTPYAKVLKQEAEVLSGQPRNYLRHDHMEEENFQYYFYQFMDEASKNGVQYLADASVASMFLGNLPQKAVVKLQEVNDIVRSEQYMDFITNRRFRSTLLCKKNVVLNRNLTNEIIKDLYFVAPIKPAQEVGKGQIEDDTDIVFQSVVNADSKVNTKSPTMKAMLTILSENHDKFLSFNNIVDQTMQKLPKANLDKNEVSVEVSSNLLRLIFSSYVNISLYPFDNIKEVSNKPKAWPFAVSQAPFNNNAWVTNQLHERVGINILDAHILKYLDGNHTTDQIYEKIAEHVKKGDITVNKDNKPITDIKAVESEVKKYIQNALPNYRRNKLLIG
jgi:methyltransferase-like protein/cyclopropane fatty-acyl-phospholipid synthase-like methyltransferase